MLMTQLYSFFFSGGAANFCLFPRAPLASDLHSSCNIVKGDNRSTINRSVEEEPHI
eukprot:m.50514 g.50514  ORF g.50514 m.50514 type:complete len:56 (+) comp15376_c0_seq1:283-450(+)